MVGLGLSLGLGVANASSRGRQWVGNLRSAILHGPLLDDRSGVCSGAGLSKKSVATQNRRSEVT